MLYYHLVTLKILRHLRFRQSNIEQARFHIPYWIATYQVPKELRRDVYYSVFKRYIPDLTDDTIEAFLNEAYPKTQIKKEIIIQAKKEGTVNPCRI